MIFSASSMTSAYTNGDPWGFTRKQIISVIVGIVGMIICMNIPLNKLKHLVPVSFIGVILLLFAVLMFGQTVKGAKSWFMIAGFSLQPTEFAKLGIILYLSLLITNKEEKFRTFSRGLAPALVIVAFITGLIYLQNDLGSALILLCCAGTVIFAGGAKLRHLVSVALILSLLAALFIGVTLVTNAGLDASERDHKASRIMAFLEPDKYQAEESYQVTQSLYAFGHGGFTGTGYGQGVQKLHYIPEAHNDFIFATIGEEFGFLGSSLFLLTYLLFIWRGIIVSVRCKEKFGMLSGVGIMGMIGFQSFVNLGGVTQTIPLTGVTLPLISYGGTSMIVTLTAMGIVLGLSRSYNQIPTK